jgi:hypothetical protein
MKPWIVGGREVAEPAIHTQDGPEVIIWEILHTGQGRLGATAYRNIMREVSAATQMYMRNGTSAGLTVRCECGCAIGRRLVTVLSKNNHESTRESSQQS